MDLTGLKQNFKGEITTHEASLEEFSRDASIFQIAPTAIGQSDRRDSKSKQSQRHRLYQKNASHC